jgi:hypothetical protein
MDYAPNEYFLSYHHERRLWLVRLAPAIPEGAGLTGQVIACPRQRYLHHVFISTSSTLEARVARPSCSHAWHRQPAEARDLEGLSRCCCYSTHYRPLQDLDQSRPTRGRAGCEISPATWIGGAYEGRSDPI